MPGNDPLIGQRLGGHLIIDLVGRGGMGTVYRAWDPELRREVALKVLPLAGLADRRDIARFQREGELAARFDHPNIVALYRTGQEAGYLYLAMELVEGQSLRRLLREQGRLPLDQALGIGEQVLMALQAAHEFHVIHRDIKAENVLLRADGTVKVLDFGVAKFDSGTVLTRVNEILGTVEYMAPEQILGEKIGPAADLYATGVLLYEMLTGSLPFTGESPATLVYHQLNQEPKPPSLLDPALSRPVDRLVLKLLDKVPENRHATAAAATVELRLIRQRHRMFDLPLSAPEVAAEEQELRTRDFRPRFVGREAPFADLCRHLEEAQRTGRVVFVAGEAGIGKTRLVEELVQHAQGRGARVIQGTCYFEHGMGPYMPFLEAVAGLFARKTEGLGESEREELRRLLAEQAPELSRLAVDPCTTARVRAGFVAGFGAEEDAGARQRFFDTVFEVLGVAARRQPLLLVVEDAQWADEGSLQLLRHLALRAGEASLLCVVTYRPEELVEEDPGSSPLGRLLRQLEVNQLLEELPLEPLARDAVAQLACSLFFEVDFSKDFHEFLYEQSEGNPFITLETLKLLRQQDILRCERGVWSVQGGFAEAGIPDRVNALVRRRIDLLDDEHRELLQLAAVVGPRFGSRVLEKASCLSRIALLKALFRLEKKHRLITGDDGVFRFSHAKIREVLYRELPWELRSEYHRIVAAVLEDQQAEGHEVEAALLGRHLYQAEEFGRALPYLERAAEEAYNLYSWRQAVSLWQQVEKASRHDGAGVERLLRALRYGGSAHSQLGQADQALEKFTQMQETARAAGRSHDEAEAWLLAGRVDNSARRFDQAIEDFTRAMECLGSGPGDPLRARILAAWGVADFENGRYEQARRQWEEGLSICRSEAPAAAGDMLNNLAVLATMQGRHEEAWGLYEQVLALEPLDAPTPQSVLTYYNMGMLRADQERWDEALELYARSLDVCQASRSSVHEPVIELNRAEALMGKGDLDGARQACGQALRGFRQLGDSLGAADGLRLYGQLCRRERRWQEGRTSLEKSVELNRQFGATVSLGEALYELGVLHCEAGQPDLAAVPWREAETIFSRADAAPDLERVRAALEGMAAA